MRTISIGAQGFEELRRNGFFYVDKTSLIKEWWESGDVVTLITRPRRFGKTLNMDMLNCFFSNQYAGREELFKDLAIWKEVKYRKLQGTFPVIFMSFADVKQNTYAGAVQIIKQTITDLYSRYYFLRESGRLNPIEQRQFDSIGPYMDDQTAQTAIRYLSGYLMKYYGKQVLILLDEYDTPLQEAYVDGYWNEINSFIRGLFNATFKSNPYLDRALMTGITRVSKESIFSDMNNPNVVTTTSTMYETAFGFTEKEVIQALAEYGMQDSLPEVRKWYDGFTFGTRTDMYNPWSITNYLKHKRFDTYWANTSSNALISSQLQKSSDSVKHTMEALLNGETLSARLDEQIVYNQLDFSEEAIWSLLLASGYLRVIEYNMDPDSKEYWYKLRLTNLEVQLMFRRLIGQWFGNVQDSYNDFTAALVQGDVEQVNRELSDLLRSMASSFDGGRSVSEESAPERFYHGLVLGLVATENRYTVRSNRESGYGRYDVALYPKSGELPGIIIEFKVFDPQKEGTLEETADRALQQILDRQYTEDMINMGLSEDHILLYGMGFSGKNVKVIMRRG